MWNQDEDTIRESSQKKCAFKIKQKLENHAFPPSQIEGIGLALLLILFDVRSPQQRSKNYYREASTIQDKLSGVLGFDWWEQELETW